MSHHKYKKIVLLSVVAMFVFFISFRWINRSIEKQLSVQLQRVKEELLVERSEPEPVQKEEKQKRPVIPNDLTPYQIVQQRKSKLFKNQQYWDIMTRDALEKSDILSRMQEGEVVKGAAMTPEEYKKRIQLIDERIRDYKRKIRTNPNDDYAQRRLQDMYMLKSTVKILRETVASNN